MSKFVNPNKNIGTVKVGQKVKVHFKLKEEGDIIKSMHSSCGCSTPVYNKETNTIVVSYVPGGIPYHLRNQGFYSSTKYINIYLKDGTQERLSFKSKIEA